jgi:hypothetical protein
MSAAIYSRFKSIARRSMVGLIPRSEAGQSQGVKCKFRGPGAQFFEVQAAESSPEMPSGDVDLEAIKKGLDQAMQQAEEQARRQIAELEEARELNPWLRRVE